MRIKGGVGLGEVEGFPREYKEKLGSLWISQAEEFISLTATPEGAMSIKSYLIIGDEELSRLVELVQKSLPKEVVRELREPVDTSNFKLGALDPKRRTR